MASGNLLAFATTRLVAPPHDEHLLRTSRLTRTRHQPDTARAAQQIQAVGLGLDVVAAESAGDDGHLHRRVLQAPSDHAGSWEPERPRHLRSVPAVRAA